MLTQKCHDFPPPGGQKDTSIRFRLGKKRKVYAKAACMKGRSHNWKARGLTRRPSKPLLDTASLGESQEQI
eukprot:1160771-Pelagomonas_calceolata.AAC.3